MITNETRAVQPYSDIYLFMTTHLWSRLFPIWPPTSE